MFWPSAHAQALFQHRIDDLKKTVRSPNISMDQRPRFKNFLNYFSLFLILLSIISALYFSKDFNLDASSDALLLEGDKDLKYLREVNDRYGSKDFLVLTYTPVSSFTEKETILNLQLLKSKIEKLTWVDSVITVIDVPLLKSTDENLMDRLKNYKNLAYPEIDKKRGFNEILNSPVFKNLVISEDATTTGIIINLKRKKILMIIFHQIYSQLKI